jgi:hypothetical protein
LRFFHLHSTDGERTGATESVSVNNIFDIRLNTNPLSVILNSAHEEIERLEQAIVDQYMSQPKTQKERLENEHVVNKFLNKITEKSKQLYDLYEDKEG